MRHTKALDQFDRYCTAEWGKFTSFHEVGDDLLQQRQVWIYSNGYALRYDRANWIDEHGSLGEAKFTEKYEKNCSKEWVTEEISKAEFERAWETALNAPNQPQEYATNGRLWPALTRP